MEHTAAFRGVRLKPVKIQYLEKIFFSPHDVARIKDDIEFPKRKIIQDTWSSSGVITG